MLITALRQLRVELVLTVFRAVYLMQQSRLPLLNISHDGRRHFTVILLAQGLQLCKFGRHLISLGEISGEGIFHFITVVEFLRYMPRLDHFSGLGEI